MKKKSLLLIAIFLLGFAIPQIAFADDNKGEQTITVSLGEVALLAIPPNIVELTLSGATVAGAPAAVALTDEDSRLRITSVVGTGTRSILAELTTGKAPVGTILQIEASHSLQNFIGVEGTSSGVQPITNSTTGAVTVITGIGTCNSGTADGDGYVLKYTFGLDADPATTAAAGSVDITITYTLSAAS